MFNKKTLIVLGAGASNEAGLPTGYELKKNIANLLDFYFEWGSELKKGDYLIVDALRRAVRSKDPNSRDINPYIEAGRKIKDALPQAISIDNYIDSHQGDDRLELCGKLAIVRSILEAEKKSKIYVDKFGKKNKLDFQATEETWYNMFFKLITENCNLEQLPERLSTIELVVFNYDRCIEHYLYHAIQTYYHVNEQAAASIVKKINIYHPYGTVGNLPWCASDNSIEYGAEPNSHQLLELASKIKTFTEGTDPNSSDISAIRNGFASSDIVLFLGFAYHRQNLRLIDPTAIKLENNHGAHYFGTAIGISDSDCGLITDELMSFGKANRINIRNNLTCAQLFRHYWRSLSLS